MYGRGICNRSETRTSILLENDLLAGKYRITCLGVYMVVFCKSNQAKRPADNRSDLK